MSEERYKSMMRQLVEAEEKDEDDKEKDKDKEKGKDKEKEKDKEADKKADKPSETSGADIELGMIVKVTSLDELDPDDLGLDKDQMAQLQGLVSSGQTAVVFNTDEDDPSTVDIVFENGLELFKVPTSALEPAGDGEESEAVATEVEELPELPAPEDEEL